MRSILGQIFDEDVNGPGPQYGAAPGGESHGEPGFHIPLQPGERHVNIWVHVWP